jgi:hypothetical protein
MRLLAPPALSQVVFFGILYVLDQRKHQWKAARLGEADGQEGSSSQRLPEEAIPLSHRETTDGAFCLWCFKFQVALAQGWLCTAAFLNYDARIQIQVLHNCPKPNTSIKPVRRV